MPDAATRAFNRLDEARKKPLDIAIMRRMWRHMKPHRRAVAVNIGLSLVLTAIELVFPRIAKHIIDVDIIANRSFTGVLQSTGVLALLLADRKSVV